MKRRILSLLLTAVASAFLAGCVQGTVSERKTSFSPYTDTRVGSQALRGFLASRTAVLLTGAHLKVTASETNPGVINFQTPSPSLVLGSAAAVDHRGYFLTAAHGVGKDPIYLVSARRGQLQVETARLVWRADLPRGEPDLALLWVPRRLDQVFEWASGFQVGEPVVAVGQNYQPPLDIEIVSVAGTLQASGTGSGPRLGARWIRHSAPLRKGDSGGPLADVEGRLIGINVKAGRTFSSWQPLGRKVGLAEHPDLAWLRQLIERHAAQAKAASPSPNQSASGDGEMPLHTGGANPAVP